MRARGSVLFLKRFCSKTHLPPLRCGSFSLRRFTDSINLCSWTFFITPVPSTRCERLFIAVTNDAAIVCVYIRSWLLLLLIIVCQTIIVVITSLRRDIVCYDKVHYSVYAMCFVLVCFKFYNRPRQPPNRLAMCGIVDYITTSAVSSTYKITP